MCDFSSVDFSDCGFTKTPNYFHGKQTKSVHEDNEINRAIAMLCSLNQQNIEIIRQLLKSKALNVSDIPSELIFVSGKILTGFKAMVDVSSKTVNDSMYFRLSEDEYSDFSNSFEFMDEVPFVVLCNREGKIDLYRFELDDATHPFREIDKLENERNVYLEASINMIISV